MSIFWLNLIFWSPPIKKFISSLILPNETFGCLINVYLVKKLQTSHPPQLIMKGQFISFEDYIWSNGSHWISNSSNCHIKNHHKNVVHYWQKKAIWSFLYLKVIFDYYKIACSWTHNVFLHHILLLKN